MIQMKTKKMSDLKIAKKSLLLKISGISSALLIIAILILAVISLRAIEDSSLETAVLMGRNKLKGDMASFENILLQEYGQISLVNNDLIDTHGNSLQNDYRIIDEISADLGVQATIFKHENQDYRRITTSIKDNTGKRVIDTFLGAGSAAYNPIQSGNDYFGTAFILGKEYLTAYRPIFAQAGSAGSDAALSAKSGNVIGILFIGIEMSSIKEYIAKTTNSHLLVIILVSSLIVIISILANVVSGRIMLLRPIRSVISMLKFLGEGDFTKQLSIKTEDEIGEMANHVNAAVDKIKSLILIIKQQSLVLGNIGNDLASNVNETTIAMNEITANIRSIKERIINQSASVSETHATMEQLTANIDKLDVHVENQSNDISLASSAIEQMVSNIRAVTETLIKNSDNVKVLMDASDVGRTDLRGVA